MDKLRFHLMLITFILVLIISPEICTRCLTKDLYTMCDMDGMKHVQNFRCDLCNIETPELAPWPSEAIRKRHRVSGESGATKVFILCFLMMALTISIVLFFVGIFIYVTDLVRPYASPPDQNIDPNPLMGSQSGSDSGIFEESVGTSSGHPF